MTTFDDRKNTFESKFAHDEEMRFKATARRNKLFGLWAAEKLGKTGVDAEAYAKEVIASDFEKPGDEDVIEKVERDLASAGQAVPAATLRAQLAKLGDAAKQQLMTEA